MISFFYLWHIIVRLDFKVHYRIMSKDIENEIKVLNIDTEKLLVELEKSDLDPKGVIFFKRYIYDIPGNKDAWIRLRTDGKKSTLTYKEYLKDAIDGVKEIETAVSDFDATNRLLTELGFEPRVYQENKRTLFTNKDIEISIDEWPKINPYVEIEGKNRNIVIEYLKRFNLDTHETTSKPTSYVYEIAGLNIDDFKELKF